MAREITVIIETSSAGVSVDLGESRTVRLYRDGDPVPGGGGGVTSVAGKTGVVTIASADISDASAAGQALMTAASAAAQRTALGLGTAATTAASAYASASHASSHQSGGGDAIKLDDLAAPDDNTDLNATTSAHGLLPKLGGGTSNFLRADGTWAAPAGGGSSNTRWIGAGELVPRVTNGAGIDGEELATNDINLDYLAFDTATSEGAQASFAWPSGFATFTATFHWTAASGSGGVRWQCSGRCYADDDALDQAQGTAQAVSDTFLLANDAHKSSATSAITPAGTVAAGNLCVVEISRAVAHVDDTLAVDARLIGVLLEFSS